MLHSGLLQGGQVRWEAPFHGNLGFEPLDNSITAENPNGGMSTFARQSQLFSHDTTCRLMVGLGKAYSEHWPSDGKVVQIGAQSWAPEGASSSEPLACVCSKSH